MLAWRSELVDFTLLNLCEPRPTRRLLGQLMEPAAAMTHCFCRNRLCTCGFVDDAIFTHTCNRRGRGIGDGNIT